MVPVTDLAQLFTWAERERFALFPLPAWSKRPGPASWFKSHATGWSKEPAQWRAWYDSTNGCNFGVECGPSQLINGDVDADERGAPMFDEFWAMVARAGGPVAATPGGGRHVYTRLPEGVVAGGCRPWLRGRIDIRAGAAYVVAPWCVTKASVDPAASDGAYILVCDGPLPIAPPELIEHCSRVEAAEAPVIAADDLAPDGLPIDPGARLQVEARVEAVLEMLRRVDPVSRTRNTTLNEAGFELGKLVSAGLLARALCEAKLRSEGEALGLTREESRATTRSALNGARRNAAERPRSSLLALLAAAAPHVERSIAWRPSEPRALAPPAPPILERLLLPGCATVLSGRSGTGKTTLAASLMAASLAGLVNFGLPGGLDAPRSDVIARPAAWVFLSWEGGQWIDAHMEAWRIGTGVTEGGPASRVTVLSRRAPWICADGRRVVADKRQSEELAAALDGASALGLPLVVALDNATSAIEDPMDQAQAAALMRMMSSLAADRDAAVLLLAHPPKSGQAAVYGSHVFVSLADIVGELEVLRRADGEWTQWISFSEKHRAAPNGRALELRSRRLDKPIMELPEDWGGDPRGRERALEDLRLPYIRQIRVRWDSERDSAKSGVTRVTEVTPKPVATYSDIEAMRVRQMPTLPVVGSLRERPAHDGKPAMLFQFPGGEKTT